MICKKSKRKLYSIKDKLDGIKQLKENEGNANNTARKLGIPIKFSVTMCKTWSYF